MDILKRFLNLQNLLIFSLVITSISYFIPGLKSFEIYLLIAFVLISISFVISKKSFHFTSDLSPKISVFILIGIILIFTAIKAPYFGYNFSGEHSMKYSSYVEPAIHMLNKMDPFWYQKKYLADPITNPEGISKEFSGIPILEWTLATTHLLSPINSLEINVRLTMHIIGIIFIVFSYLVVSKWSNRIFALITCLLLATNPIIGFSTFVTVYDALNIMLLMISLFFLNKYLENKKLNILILAGLIVGIGIGGKFLLLAWSLPLVTLIVLQQKSKFIQKYYEICTYGMFSVIPLVISRISIEKFPSHELKYFIYFVLSIIITVVLIKLINNSQEFTLKTLGKLHNRRLLIPISIILGLVLFIIAFKFFISKGIVEEFLTDEKLIVNVQLYKYMLIEQFKTYLTDPVFIIALGGFFTFPFIFRKKAKIFLISVITTMLIYWILASKVIFFHSYYSTFIILSFILFATTFIFSVVYSLKGIYLRLAFGILLSILIFPQVINETQAKLKYQRDGEWEAVEYLTSNTNPGDLYLDEQDSTSLTLYTGISRVGDITMLENKEFKDSIKEIGFKETMKRYKIKYLITESEKPNYMMYANIFTKETLVRPNYRRSDLILSIINPEKYSYYTDLEERSNVVIDYNINEKFVFEKQIGVYRFYTFTD